VSYVGIAIAVVVFFVLAIVGAKACREYQIDRCEERGGRAITAPWFSDRWAEVRCIEP